MRQRNTRPSLKLWKFWIFEHFGAPGEVRNLTNANPEYVEQPPFISKWLENQEIKGLYRRFRLVLRLGKVKLNAPPRGCRALQ